jgi:hypothetical protein
VTVLYSVSWSVTVLYCMIVLYLVIASVTYSVHVTVFSLYSVFHLVVVETEVQQEFLLHLPPSP